MDRYWVQLGKQVAWIAVGTTWTFVVTYAIMFVINLIPGLHFRADDEAQVVGMDEVEHDEYVADYAFFRRDAEDGWQHETQSGGSYHSEKSPESGAVTNVHPVGDPQGDRPIDMQARGRGEGGTHEDVEMSELPEERGRVAR